MKFNVLLLDQNCPHLLPNLSVQLISGLDFDLAIFTPIILTLHPSNSTSPDQVSGSTVKNVEVRLPGFHFRLALQSSLFTRSTTPCRQKRRSGSLVPV